MYQKSCSIARMMGCCGCFGFSKKPKRVQRPASGFNRLSEELLLGEDMEDEESCSSHDEMTSTTHEEETDSHSRVKNSEEILRQRTQNGLICRQFPVKETNKVVRSEDDNGNKMVNEYVRECKIGSGSYGKVVLYRSHIDGKYYAIKAFHKSHLSKLRVAPSETAMTDVLREVLIMKMLEHPNIVNLFEVIDDPDNDRFYMGIHGIFYFLNGFAQIFESTICLNINFEQSFFALVLEYVEGKWACEGCDPPRGLDENIARKYLRDIVSGLMYLHAHHIVHGDIKPDNLLVTRDGTVKIGDFSVSQVFEDDNDELRRSPGTPVFTAPECCLGITYHGKAADTWAVGVTLYCMILGQYPFLGETLQDTYDKIVNNPLVLPDDMNLQLRDLLEGILCKDPNQRMTLDAIAKHSWVIGDEGPIPQYLCWCKRKTLLGEEQSNLQREENGIKYDDFDVAPRNLSM